MEIKFKLIDEKNIAIIGIESGEEKEIGCIFTPAGSGQNIKNAIQVCGIAEAYDFWGCARYSFPIDVGNSQKRVIDTLKGDEEKLIQAKDIQLIFSMETSPSNLNHIECEGCYNNPCTCENRENHKHTSTYNVKREGDVYCEYTDGRILTPEERAKEREELEELLKKYGKEGKGK